MCHSTNRAGRGAGAGGGVAAACEGTTIASRMVITFSQVLQRIFRTFCLTLSSAMEYLVWQRSQTNFIADEFRAVAPIRFAAYHTVSAGRGAYYNPTLASGQSEG